MRINRAMLRGVLGFIVAGATAAVDGRIAIQLPKQGIAAIGNSAADDAQGASFADGGAGFPLGINALGADFPEPGGGEFAQGFEKVTRDAGRGY